MKDLELNGWIPTKEKCPNYHCEVFVFCKDDLTTHIAHAVPDDDGLLDGFRVDSVDNYYLIGELYWKPINFPNPPKIK